MGQEQSILERKGYKIEAQKGHSVVATKDNEKFLIRKLETGKDKTLISELETLKETTHPHIASTKNSFKDEDGEYVIVMDYCPGGTLAEKITSDEHPRKYKALSWTVEICMALEFIHEKKLLHKDVTPRNIFLTEAGTLCLGECGKNVTSRMGSDVVQYSSYLAPEVFTEETYNAQSEIWSLGCILHEAYTHTQAFSAKSKIELEKKIISGECSPLPDHCSSEFRELLGDILSTDPGKRPTASEILARPIMIRCLGRKCIKMTEHLQNQLMKLREVAESLERVHQKTTIGSLAGGVVGAAGGITSIVGLALAPFTLGASLIVTGVGIGVGVAGGVAAGASNITKMVNETSDRKAVRSIIQEFDVKIKAMALWFQEVCSSLEKLRTCCDEDSGSNQNKLSGVAAKLGRGLGGVAELGRLLRVVNIGKIAAQASRAVRVAEAATGVLTGLFLAADLFFIAMDAREIHRIRKGNNNGETRSEIMKFVKSIRDAADELQKVLDVFKEITLSFLSAEDDMVLERRHMK